jgi:hypothetical protein
LQCVVNGEPHLPSRRCCVQRPAARHSRPGADGVNPPWRTGLAVLAHGCKLGAKESWCCAAGGEVAAPQAAPASPWPRLSCCGGSIHRLTSASHGLCALCVEETPAVCCRWSSECVGCSEKRAGGNPVVIAECFKLRQTVMMAGGAFAGCCVARRQRSDVCVTRGCRCYHTRQLAHTRW